MGRASAILEEGEEEEEEGKCGKLENYGIFLT